MDRKARIRESKQRRPLTGVYRIRNAVTGDALAAAAVALNAILNRHRATG